MKFIASRLAATPINASYGYLEDPSYYTQTFLRNFPGGSYGCGGPHGSSDYGEFSDGAGSALQAVGGLTVGLVGLGMQSQAAKREREHEIALAREQQKSLEIQGKYGGLGQEEDSGWGWTIAGIVVTGLLVGGGVYWWTTKKAAATAAERELA